MNDQQKSATRIAIVLFVLCLVVLGTAVNQYRASTIYWQEWNRAVTWVDALGDMLGRSRTFQDKSPAFFASMMGWLLSQTPTSVPQEGHLRVPSLDLFHFPSGHLKPSKPEEKEGDPSNKNRRALIRFGEAAAKTYSKHNDAEKRRQELTNLVNTFVDKEFPAYRRHAPLKLLAQIDAPVNWEVVVQWIVHGLPWFDPEHEPDSQEGLQHDMLVRRHIKEQLWASKPPESEQMLRNLWENAYTKASAMKPRPIEIQAGGVGLSINALGLLLLAAPAIVVLQLLFLVMDHSATEPAPISKIPRSFISFPRLGSPHDPLNPLVPSGLVDFGGRLLWLLFCALPLALISVGIMTEWNMPDGFYIYWSPYPSRFAYIDFISLALSILVTFFLTTDSNAMKERLSPVARFIAWRLAAVLIAIIIGPIAYRWFPGPKIWATIGDTLPGVWSRRAMMYAVIWVLGLLFAFDRRNRTLFAFSLIALAFYVWWIRSARMVDLFS